MITDLWAVIPSCCRTETLVPLVTQLLEDDVYVVIVDTGLHHSVVEQLAVPGVTILPYQYRPKNISKWWNVGLDYVNFHMGVDEYVVAVLNDDVVIPPKFVQSLAGAIEFHGAAAAYPDVYNMGRDFVEQRIPEGPRMAGFAFALRGSAHIRADNSMAWWYGDNDIDWQARQKGGTVLVGGLQIQHLYPNSTTVGELAEQAGRDREVFVAKWGIPPW